MSFMSLIKLFYRIFSLSHSKLFASNEVTDSLCTLKTDALIKHYGYEAEVHKVTTADGYILTVFRCNSKRPPNEKRKPVIVQHGILITSDDFCISPSSESLAYVLADADYDVWLPNSRGNFYSLRHTFRNPKSLFSGFWNFSYYEMGIYDQPAVIDYVLQQTDSSKLHYVGYSQGATSIMVLLSEKPEYNEKIHVASLLAPGGYMSHVGVVIKLLAFFSPLLHPIKLFGVLNRSRLLNYFINFICEINLQFCNNIIDLFCGPSDNQRRNDILPVFICHFPSGSSIKQLVHYGQQVNLGFFGKYMTGLRIPHDYPLSRITAPLSIHYSTADQVAVAKDVEKLIAKLSNVVHVQCLDEKLNHIDFIWGMYSADLIYSNILDVFNRFQSKIN